MVKGKLNLVGFCYDAKSSFLKGAAQAPPLIRKALFSPSTNPYTELSVKVNQDLILDHGDLHPADYFEISTWVRDYQPDLLMAMGGDHSITYPIIKAYSDYTGPFEILQIDAHSDLYDEFEGDRFSHACPFARIMEEDLVSGLTQVGIRTMTPHLWEQADRFGVNVQEMKSIDSWDLSFSNPVYISLDMDVFDPAYAPGVSHQEPGGMTSRQVLNLIHSIDAPIIGADIVEFNPERDVSGITAALAGKMAKEIIGKMNRKGR